MAIVLLSILLVGVVILVVLATKNHGFNGLWMISPPVMMCGLFVAAQLPGVILTAAVGERSSILAAHFLWFIGVLFALIITPGAGSDNLPARNYLRGNVSVFRGFLLLGFVSIVVYYLALGRVPLFIAIGGYLGGGDGMTLMEARRANTLMHRSGDTFYFGQGYIKHIFLTVAPVFLVAYVLLKRSKGMRLGVGLLGLAFVFMFSNILNGGIGPAVLILIFYFAAYVLYKRLFDPGYSFKSLLRYGVIAYLAAVLLIMGLRILQAMGGRNLETPVIDAIHRTFTYLGAPMFDVFPRTYPFRFGETWINDLSGMLPGAVEAFAYEAHYLAHGGGWGYTLWVGIVAGAYINFGLVGPLVTGFALGLIYNVLFVNLSRSNSAVRLAVCVMISHGFATAMMADLVTYVVNLVTAFAIIAIYIVLNSMLRLGRNVRTVAGVRSTTGGRF
ncbi:O-antigen polymerase [Luteimonas sp. MJ246]|uniref:O-antigen polymerase n=1 Tax=Luteimonas sp. MJ174 TaxID=3129237 RepID=UPI0031BBC2E2